MLGNARFPLLAAATAILAAPSAAYSEGRAQFDLPSQSLAASLRALGSQTSTNVLFDPPIVEGRSAPALKAEIMLDQAFTWLLAGTGLKHRFLDEKTVVVISAAETDGSDKTTARLPGYEGVRLASNDSSAARGQMTQSRQQEAGSSDTVSTELIGLQEVTVTAQRVSARLQDVPLSVTAMSSEELQNHQVLSALDLGRQVPNLVGNPNAGMGSAAAYYLRGVGQDESISTTEPAVGVYVDGVYLSRVVSNNLLLYDMERVEVLRGPQGTLYGRNTSGGAIKFITKKPNANFGGYVDASYEFEYDRHQIGASVNMPFTDTLFGKLSALNTKQREGFIDNVTTGQEIWAPETSGARAQLRWAPNDSIDIVAGIDYLKDEGQELIGQNMLGAPRDTLYEVVSGLDNQFVDTQTKAFTLNASFEVGGLRLESTTGIRELDERFLIDLSDLTVPAFTIPTVANYRQWSQEFTLGGDSGPVSWLAGVFYMNERTRSFIGDELNLFGGAFVANFMKDLRSDTKSTAAFAQATWHVTDRVDLTAGARYTEESKDLRVDQYEVLAATAPGAGSRSAPRNYPGARGPLLPMWDTADLQAQGTDTSPTFTNFDPKLGIDYRVNDSLLLFASWTEGFKSGGWNSRVTDALDFVQFDPETVSSYELGAKSEWFDRRVRANVTLFYADYDDFQITAVNPASGGFVTLNAAKMRNQGVEAELTWWLSESLNLIGNVATMDAKYTESASPLVSRSTKVKNTPELSYMLGADLRHPLPKGWLVGNVLYTHKSDYFANLDNSDAGYVPAVGLFDAMAGYETDDGAWRVALSCKNCSDKEAVHSTLDFAALGFATRYQITPRQVFLSLRYNFAGG